MSERLNIKEASENREGKIRLQPVTLSTMAFLAFVAVPYESARAVDIPPNASYEEGIKLLHSAVQNEAFETHATAIMIKDKDGNIKAIRWTSKEGEERSVSRDKDKWVSEIVKSAQALGLGKGDVLFLEEFHTHPVKAADKEDANKKIFMQVMPPSPGSDINFFQYAKLKHALKNKLHANFVITSAVVDSYGVWRIEYNDNAPTVKLADLITGVSTLIDSKKGIIKNNLAQMNTKELANLLKEIYNSAELTKEYEFIDKVRQTIPEIITLLNGSDDKSKKELVVQLAANVIVLLLKAMAISDEESLNKLLKGAGIDTGMMIKLSKYMKKLDRYLVSANQGLLGLFSVIRDSGSNLDRKKAREFANSKFVREFIAYYGQMGVNLKYDLLD